MRYRNCLSLVAVAVALTLAAVAPVAAQTEPEYPILSVARVSLAAGVNYEFYSGSDDGALPPFEKEWTVAAYGSYAMTRHLSLAAHSAYGLDNRQFRSSLGVRVLLFKGGD